jgi:hypothetical protein
LELYYNGKGESIDSENIQIVERSNNRDFPTMEEAIEGLKDLLEVIKIKKGKKETVFNVFQDRKLRIFS